MGYDCGADLKVVIFLSLPLFTRFLPFPSLSLKRTLNYSFGEAVYVVWGKASV